MEQQITKYPVTIAGQKLILTFEISDAPTKKGVNMMFVMENEPEDPKVKQQLQNKLSIVLQKKYGEAGVPIDFNERNPYKNVISYIVPLSSLGDNLVSILKSGNQPSKQSFDDTTSQ